MSSESVCITICVEQGILMSNPDKEPKVLKVNDDPRSRSQKFLEDGKEFDSVFDKFEKLKVVFANFGVTVLNGGDWQGVTLLANSTVEWKGETYPILRKLSPSNSGHIERIRQILASQPARIAIGEPDLYYSICRSMVDLSANNQIGVINELMTGKEPETNYQSYKMSKLDPFPLLKPTGSNSKQHINSLLSWLPESERNILALSVGRLFSLKKGHWRTVPVISGRAGLGKSTFINKLSQKLNDLGFETPAIQPNLNRFSLSVKLAQSHLLIADDTTTADIKKLTENSQFKSLITGFETSIEEKYKQPISIVPNCVLFFLGNGIKPSDLIGADTGILDRLTILECDPNFTGSTDGLLSDLSQETGHSEDYLMSCLIEECVGYYDSIKDMELTMNNLKENLIAGCTGQALIEAASAFTYLQYWGGKYEVKEALQYWSVRGVMDAFMKKKGILDSELESTFSEIVWRETRENLKNYFISTTSFNEKGFLSCVVTRSGVTLPTTLAPYRKLTSDVPNHKKAKNVLDTLARVW